MRFQKFIALAQLPCLLAEMAFSLHIVAGHRQRATGHELFGWQAVSQPPAFSGFAEDRTPAWGARAAGTVSRRGFLAAGAAATMLPPPSAEASPAGSWPEVPPWIRRSPVEPRKLPADIDERLDARAAGAGDLAAATEQALSAFRHEADPETRERELIAFALLGARAARGDVPQDAKIRIITQLGQLMTSDEGSLLWNQEEALNRVYRAFWPEVYDQFQKVYKYRPVSPADLGWLNEVLPRMKENRVLEARPFMIELQDAGCALAFQNLMMVVRWSQRSKPERDALVQVASEVARVVPGSRLRTPQAMQALDNLARLRLNKAALPILEPGVPDFARKLDLLFTDHRIQLDDLVTILPYRPLPGMQAILADPARFQDALQEVTGQSVIHLMNIAQQPEGLLMAKLLNEQYGYKLSSADFMAFALFRSKKDLEDRLALAKRIFGGIPAMNATTLVAVANLWNMPPSSREMLQRLFGDSPPPLAVDIFQSWTGAAYAWPGILTSLRTTQDAFWRRVADLKAAGWEPGAEKQPGMIWSWLAPQTPVLTARALYREKGWPLRSTSEITTLRSLTPEQLADLSGLPPEARADIYLEMPENLLTRLRSDPALWRFFIEVHRRGYFTGKLFAESDHSQWQIQAELFYLLLRGLLYNANVQVQGWGVLEQLKAVSQDPVLEILLKGGVTYQMQPRQTPAGPVIQQVAVPQWAPWIEPGFLAAVKNLNGRTGYRLSGGDTVGFVTRLASDEVRMSRAAEIRDRTKVTPTAALQVILKDEHLKRLYEDPRMQELLKVLVNKGYQWNAADTEFIYHLAQRRVWRRRISDPKRGAISPDMREIKFAYLAEQLNRPELRAAIRQNVREDLADLFTEFGGLFAFEPNGDLVLVPLPSMFGRAKDPENNGNFSITPFDFANMQWFAGRFFAFYHNHAVAALKIVTRASQPDRAVGQTIRNEIGLSILIAAEPAPEGLLRVQAFTAGSIQKEAGVFQWTEPMDIIYFIQRFIHRLQRRPAAATAHPRPSAPTQAIPRAA